MWFLFKTHMIELLQRGGMVHIHLIWPQTKKKMARKEGGSKFGAEIFLLGPRLTSLAHRGS